MEVEQVDVNAVQSFVPDIADLAERSRALVIDSHEAAQRGVAIKLGFTAMRKVITEYFKPHADAANKLHKWITGRRESALDSVKPHETALDKKLNDWDNLQKKLAAEAAAKAEADRQAAQSQADMLEMLGADPTPVAIFAPEVAASPKLEGLALVTYYSAEHDSIMDTAKAIVAGTLPPEALLPNIPWANLRAKSMRDEFVAPGYRLVVKKTPRGSAR